MKNVLILDDDQAQLAYMSNLLKDDFKIQTSNNPIAAYNICSQENFDAVIVDVHMPIINGFDFIKSINNLKMTSALFILSSDTSSQTKLQALNMGVKDFLWPEMQKEEIVLRIKNHLGHAQHSELVKSYKDITIDVTNFSVTVSKKKIDLTLTEFKMLSLLVSHATEIVSRDELKDFTWPEAMVLDKTINTHLTNLRLKLAESEVEIKSVKGEGILLA